MYYWILNNTNDLYIKKISFILFYIFNYNTNKLDNYCEHLLLAYKFKFIAANFSKIPFY